MVLVSLHSLYWQGAEAPAPAVISGPTKTFRYYDASYPIQTIITKSSALQEIVASLYQRNNSNIMKVKTMRSKPISIAQESITLKKQDKFGIGKTESLIQNRIAKYYPVLIERNIHDKRATIIQRNSILTKAVETINPLDYLIEPIQIDEDIPILIELERELSEEFRQNIINISIGQARDDSISSAWFGNFKDFNKEDSTIIRNILQTAFVNNQSKLDTIALLQTRMGLSEENARRIVDTEYQQMRNRARELAYRDEDPKDEGKYIWDTKRDSRVCPICQSIKKQSLSGVSLTLLKDIIQSTAREFDQDGTRSWIAHVGDRCRVARIS